MSHLRFSERKSRSTSAVEKVGGVGEDNESSPRMGVDTLDKHWRSAIFCVSYPAKVMDYPRISTLVTGRGIGIMSYRGKVAILKKLCAALVFIRLLYSLKQEMHLSF